MPDDLSLTLVLDPRRARLLKQAAASAHCGIEDYVVKVACAAADAQLSKTPELQLDDPEWERLLMLLEQPANELAILKSLLVAATPSAG